MKLMEFNGAQMEPDGAQMESNEPQIEIPGSFCEQRAERTESREEGMTGKSSEEQRRTEKLNRYNIT